MRTSSNSQLKNRAPVSRGFKTIGHPSAYVMYDRWLLQKYGDDRPITVLYMIYIYYILCELGISFDCKALNKQIRDGY